MKDRPILFSAPMVRALLDGSKTQTRRIIRPPRWAVEEFAWTDDTTWDHDGHEVDFCCRHTGCMATHAPYGQPGDRLWVRETWSVRGLTALGPISRTRHASPKAFVYAADGLSSPCLRYRPSIHMPRWASRLTLEITDVRVQRLLEISDEDAEAEGVDAESIYAGRGAPGEWLNAPQTFITPYRRLWESINGAGSWDANPLVWALTFKQVAA